MIEDTLINWITVVLVSAAFALWVAIIVAVWP